MRKLATLFSAILLMAACASTPSQVAVKASSPMAVKATMTGSLSGSARGTATGSATGTLDGDILTLDTASISAVTNITNTTSYLGIQIDFSVPSGGSMTTRCVDNGARQNGCRFIKLNVPDRFVSVSGNANAFTTVDKIAGATQKFNWVVTPLTTDTPATSDSAEGVPTQHAP